MLAAVSSNEVWQKIVDFFTITVKDFFVELLAENPPIKFILIVAGAALVLIGLIVIIAVCAKKNKAKKAAKKAARQSVKDAKKARKSGKVAAEEKPAVKETPVVPATPAPAPVAAAAPAPAPYIEDEKKFDADAFDDELPPFEDKKPAPQEQIDMSKFIAEEKVYAPVEEEKPVAPAPVPAYVQPEEPAPVEGKHYIEPENNDNFVDDSWGKAKINLKPKKAQKEETTEEPEVAAEEPAPAKKKATKKKAEVTEEAAPAKKAPAKKKAAAKVEEPVEENDEADKPKVVGKYTIEDTGYAYQFHLYANNGQLLYESREYASLNSCKGGIATFKKNVADCEYRIDVDKNGGYKYIFKKGNSIYIGETYSTAKAAERSAESVKRFAQVSEISE